MSEFIYIIYDINKKMINYYFNEDDCITDLKNKYINFVGFNYIAVNLDYIVELFVK